MEPEHEVDGGGDVGIFIDAGILPVIGDPGGVEPVDPAEDHRDLTEDVVAKEEEKLEGVVVGGDDQVKRDFSVLGGVEGAEGGGIDRAVNPFGAHELDEEAASVPVGVDAFQDTQQLFIGPFVPLVVGVEDEDILLVR